MMIQKPTKSQYPGAMLLKAMMILKTKLFIREIILSNYFHGGAKNARFKSIKSQLQVGNIKMFTSTNYEKPIACRSFSFLISILLL